MKNRMRVSDSGQGAHKKRTNDWDLESHPQARFSKRLVAVAYQ